MKVTHASHQPRGGGIGVTGGQGEPLRNKIPTIFLQLVLR